MTDFTHLHCHSEYSLLDGAIRLKDLCKRAKDYGMSHVAVTDHGNMYAALPFYLEAREFGLKPILGCEVYTCRDHTDKTSDFAKERFHLVLLAQNLAGYHNLVKLVSQAALYGFHYRPRVDKTLLRKYSEGVIALSACLAGEVPRALQRFGMDEALKVAKEYADIYPERFFLELQENGLAEQKTVNAGLLEIADKTGLPLVATNDCHYLDKTDVEAHDILLCIQTQSQVDDPKRMRFETKELYYKSPEEMEKDFARHPEALANTMRIAEMCEDYNFNLKDYHFPVYKLPEGKTMDEEFRGLARDGLERRLEKLPYRVDEEAYRQRLEYELDVICKMEFPAYFMIVQDFINWAKDNGIPVGPGRGSAAGSLAAWSLRITNLDPIPYNLLFERFLNIERISMPDIDVDFCERKRQQVIQYVADRYGADSVAQITTFGKMKAKAVVRDVGRALGLTFQETDRIAKLIPEDLKMTVQKAIDQEPDLQALYKADPKITKLLDVSRRLEGLSRHASTHAAGVVISDRPMIDYLPVYRGKREEVVTQFPMKMVEKVGLVKFDFLGLRTMTLIQDTLDNISLQGQTPPDLDTLPLTDPDTYRLYASGDTDGIFQVESSGMRKYLRMLKPSVFEDIIAMLALYRPGPLGSGMVDEFIKRKHGEVKVSYPLPTLQDCLKDTYGVIVYQEQVMQIAQIVAGYTLGGAALLRRAMGKKDPAAMAAERGKFVHGAQANNVPEKKANEIFDLMEKFAEYGFNKSHSAAYALISYHTAYLKAHHKAEFMAALLTSEMGNQDKVLKYVAACKDMAVEVERPSVQESRREFTVRNGRIIYGLGGVKNVGDEAIREIVDSRAKDGPFLSMLDLCCRVNMRKVTKRVLENLIKGGAFDCLGCTRAGMAAALDAVVAKAQKKKKDQDSNQMSLFTLMPEPAPQLPGIGLECPEQAVLEWTNDVKLGFEKEALGFYLTSHPLQPFRREIARLELTPLEECRDLPAGAELKCALLINSVKEYITKKGTRMAFCQVSDLTASGECTFFPEPYAEYRDLLNSEQPLLVHCRISAHEGAASRQFDEAEDEEEQLREIKLLGEKVLPLAKASQESVNPLILDLKNEQLTPERLEQLKSLLLSHPGQAPVQARLRRKDMWCLVGFGPSYAVQPGPELSAGLALWSEAV